MKSQGGFSLVGVMMSIAIGAITSYALLRMIVSINQTRAALEYTAERDETFELIRYGLNISENCDRNFVGKSISTTHEVPILYANASGDGTTENILFQVNTNPSYKGFRITKMILKPGTLLEDESKYIAEFEIHFAKDSALTLKKSKKMNLAFNVAGGFIAQCLNAREE